MVFLAGAFHYRVYIFDYLEGSWVNTIKIDSVLGGGYHSNDCYNF